ncbi:MAG: hypothetical protein M1825_004265 [Sarcosagium campestre]|nr:MAG: hypothetical protein M1825_004265 [Sarcosagium campestre]
MSSPLRPPKALRDHCSIIYNNTLYAFSPEGFQSLPLEEGGEWKELSSGVPVADASCVDATTSKDKRKHFLYVIGGTRKTTKEAYTGIQRYQFAEKKWESLDVEDADVITQNRTKHSAVYLEESSTILIYAGDQNGSTIPSSATFLLSTLKPYSLTSLTSKAPPAVDPMLLAWNESHAVNVGGSNGNKQVSIFSPSAGWSQLDITLRAAIGSDEKAALVNGDDGSKVLEVFDMSKSPNTVGRIVLQGPDGKPSKRSTKRSNSARKQQRSSSPPPAKRRKRDLTLAEWPEYNSTLAPKTKRSRFSIAQDSKGLVVISGDDDQEPLAIFDAQRNEWQNATDFIKGKEITVDTSAVSSISGVPSGTKTAAPTTTAETSAAAATGPSGKSRALKILGATLGGIFGVAFLLILVLVLLRWRKKKRLYRDAAHHRRASGNPGDEKDRLSFADRGTSSMGNFAGLGWTPDQFRNSSSSSAIISGRSENVQKGTYLSDGDSNGYMLSKVKGKSPLGDPDSTQPKGVAFAPMPAGEGTSKDGAGKERSSGWSRYFSGNSATNLVHMGGEGSNDAGADSHGNARITSEASHDSARVPPLSGARAADARTFPLAGSGRPNADRHESSGTESSDVSRDAFSSGIPASVHDDSTWTPIGRQHWSSDRAPSSVYTNSMHGSMLPRDINADAFPAVPRDSTVTTFPGAGPGVAVRDVHGYDGDRQGNLDPAHSDMSWLNLGHSRE